ncbi:MAG: ABC transporter substrate-binding protein, partial [Candidatus Thorarchaeota archaeon]
VKSRLPLGIMLGLLLVGFAAGAVQTPIPITSQCRVYWGPLIDKVVYDVIPERDQQVLALQNDRIDLIGDLVDPSLMPVLEASENIETETTPTNSYVALSINCRKYPLNLTAFRRAFAYALDKEGIAQNQQLVTPLDSVVTRASPFTIEGMSEENYYSSQIDKAEGLLDEAGFSDRNEDGVREAPDGSAFNVSIRYREDSESAKYVCEAAASTLTEVGINATAIYSGYEYIGCGGLYRLDYDIMYFRLESEDLDVQWLANEYWSENVDSPYSNIPGFRNEIYDSYRESLIHSAEYDVVLDAAHAMQRILVYESPIVVCYEELAVSAYRDDKFDNLINMPVSGLLNWWTMCRARLIDEEGGPFGGTFRIGVSEEFDSFNPLTSHEWESGLPLSLMFDSLVRRNVDGEDVPFLAEEWTIETHEDNPSIPVGHSRITFQLEESATWSDDTILAAEDVVYTINQYRDQQGSHFGDALDDLYAVYYNSDTAVVTEFRTESYWNLYDVCFIPILQKKQCSERDVLEWDPDPLVDPLEIHGPFIVSDRVEGEFVEMTYNPDYYYLDPKDLTPALSTGLLNGYSRLQLTVIEGTVGNEMSWSLFGSFSSYEIRIDSALVHAANLSLDAYVGIISISVDGLEAGDHTVSITAVDHAGVIHEDTANLTVVSSVPLFLSGFIPTFILITMVACIGFFRRDVVENN